VTKMSLPQRDHTIKALLLDRASESLSVRIAVRCPERRPNDPDEILRAQGTWVAVTPERATVRGLLIKPDARPNRLRGRRAKL